MHVRALDQFHLMLIPQSLQGRLLCHEIFNMARGIGQLAKAPAQITINAVFFYALAHQIHRVQPQSLEYRDAFAADGFFVGIQVVTNPANQLAAVAACGPPGDVLRLKHNHRVTTFRQLNGGVQAGKACANDADVRLHLALKGRAVERLVARGAVIGVR